MDVAKDFCNIFWVMPEEYIYAIVVMIVLVGLYFLFRYSYYNTTAIVAGGESYYVHREHHNGADAAKLLREVIERNKILMKYLELKYNISNLGNMNPEKAGKIDVIPMGDDEDDIIASNMPYLLNDMNYLGERVVQLKSRYKVDRISEISPLNPSGSTSYTENKGEKLVLCLRNKEPNLQGEYEFHDINLIMFVVLHELTHVMNDRWGHKMQFWQLFKFVLQNAVECDIYKPIDYRKDPARYCGMDITYNPYYDSAM